MKEAGRTAVAEQFRVFRTNMDFLVKQKQCPIVLVTSTMSGEGKSFISSNLAAVYGYGEKKVLLMEMDLRKPKLSAMLGVPNESGFTSYIIGNGSINDYIKSLPTPNIFILNSGPVPPNPAELLMSEKVKKMFEELKSQFDVIIIDSAPIGAVTDAQILADHSDVNLFVMRQNYSYKNSVELINELIERERIENLYIIVNDVKKGSLYRYGYGNKYGYGYGYGYLEKRKKKRFKIF
jgi:capsular exopolysaccharide synthesis family protein